MVFYTHQCQLFLLWFNSVFFSFFSPSISKLVIHRRKCTLKHISHLTPGTSSESATPKEKENVHRMNVNYSTRVSSSQSTFAAANRRNEICMNVVLGGFSLQVRKDVLKQNQ